jgi:hypothetical protein
MDASELFLVEEPWCCREYRLSIAQPDFNLPASADRLPPPLILPRDLEVATGRRPPLSMAANSL